MLAQLVDKAASAGQREGEGGGGRQGVGGAGARGVGKEGGGRGGEDSCSRATVAHLSGHASAGS